MDLPLLIIINPVMQLILTHPPYGGFSLTTKTNAEIRGYVALFALTTEEPERSDPRPDRSDPNPKVHQVETLFRYDDRISTLTTWPKPHPIHPESYVKAGFYYSGEGDVICRWCHINLKERYDVPRDEHQRHSHYSFLLMLSPFPNYHFM